MYHHASPASPFPLSVRLFVQLFHSECVREIEQDSCQTRLLWVKMAGEVLFFFQPLPSCSHGSQLKPAPPQPALHYNGVVLPEQKDREEEAGSVLQQVGE